MSGTAVLVCVFLVHGCVYYTRGQDCSSFADCRSCIQSPLQYQWCSKPNIAGRCTPANVSNPNCEAEFVVNPIGSQTVLRNDSLSDDVQITPQAVSLKVRPGQPQPVAITVRPAATFPLDVYFLMDFSNSMRDALQTLQSIAGDISQDISSITPNFTLGFGSFVDKRTSPYVDVRPDQLQTPCRDLNCEGPYSYRHFLSLTNNSDEFAMTVNNRIISGNFDLPEGGMDGLLQAVVCQDVIGWRKNPARRLLVYMSDAGFHFGGDGKIGGAVTPHDGQCHLRRVTNGGETYYEYEEALRLDYPSIGMVNYLLLERGISPIFLVTPPEQDLYRQLQTGIDNAVLGLVDSISSNLIGAFRVAYNELASNVRFTAESVPGLEVSFSANCGAFAIPDANGGCTSVTISNEVTITATVSVTECTERLINGTSFKIFSTLFGEVTLDVQGVCSCECEMDRMTNSSDCSNQGDLVCGICECVEGRSGDRCECNITSMDNSWPTSLICPTGANGLVCSGPDAGECVCGQCKCKPEANSQITGYLGLDETCSMICRNSQCGIDTIWGLLCSGNGLCSCNGTCTCNEGFSGDICDCRPNEECRDPVGGELCSGVGDCECGVCTCNSGYGGAYCHFCTNAETCGSFSCSQFTNCTTCLYSIVDGVFQETGVESCQSICDAVNATVMADTISGPGDPRLNSTFTCTTAVVDGQCSGIRFYVKSNTNEYTEFDILVSNSTAYCPSITSIQPWVIAVPVGLLILSFGFIIIILVKGILLLKGDIPRNLHETAYQEMQNPTYIGGNYVAT